MHSTELPTVNSVHKATELAKASHLHISTNGTTLNQQKVNALAINCLCLGVGEVPDGTAVSVLEHVNRELNNL